MNTDIDVKRWQKIEGIIDKALTMDQPRRKRYIYKACGYSYSMIEEVYQLLESIRAAEYYGFLEKE